MNEKHTITKSENYELSFVVTDPEKKPVVGRIGQETKEFLFFSNRDFAPSDLVSAAFRLLAIARKYSSEDEFKGHVDSEIRENLSTALIARDISKVVAQPA